MKTISTIKIAFLLSLAIVLSSAVAADLKPEQKKQWATRIEKVCVPLMNKHKRTNKNLAGKDPVVVCKCIAQGHIQHTDGSGSLQLALAHLAWVEAEYRNPNDYVEDDTGNMADVDMQIAAKCLGR